MEESDLIFKNSLRMDLIVFERIRELLNSDRQEEALEDVEKQIRRINASLQD